MEPPIGFEPTTSPLPRKCSAPELRGHKLGAGNRIRTSDLLITNQPLYQLSYASKWSGKRGSNPQPTAWKAVALPIELLPHSKVIKLKFQKWWEEQDSNLRRLCQRIYSPPPLAAQESSHTPKSLQDLFTFTTKYLHL